MKKCRNRLKEMKWKKRYKSIVHDRETTDSVRGPNLEISVNPIKILTLGNLQMASTLRDFDLIPISCHSFFLADFCMFSLRDFGYSQWTRKTHDYRLTISAIQFSFVTISTLIQIEKNKVSSTQENADKSESAQKKSTGSSRLSRRLVASLGSTFFFGSLLEIAVCLCLLN
jgi:hypothetical protein